MRAHSAFLRGIALRAEEREATGGAPPAASRKGDRRLGMEPLKQKLLMMNGPRQAGFHERSLPAPGPRDVVIRPILSTFKHGTEMMAFTGNSPFARRSFNAALRLFEDRGPADPFYPRPMGSMTVGEIEWAGAGADGLSPGDAVYAWAPVADRHVLPAAMAMPIGDLSLDEALCIDPASFALGAVIDGAIGPSETVLVTGLGAIGLFVVQYARAFGARVIAASRFAKRRALAEAFGAEEIHDSAAHGDLARVIKERRGGVDAAVECSGSMATLSQAIRATRQCGRVVCVGFYGPADERLNLGEEFFHNRISLLASLPALSWGNPTRGEVPLLAKDLQRRVIADFGAKTIRPDGILGPVLPFDRAVEAVKLIAEAPEAAVKVLIGHGAGQAVTN